MWKASTLLVGALTANKHGPLARAVLLLGKKAEYRMPKRDTTVPLLIQVIKVLIVVILALVALLKSSAHF